MPRLPEQSLRQSYESCGMSEREIEAALDMYEASNPDDEDDEWMGPDEDNPANYPPPDDDLGDNETVHPAFHAAIKAIRNPAS